MSKRTPLKAKVVKLRAVSCGPLFYLLYTADLITSIEPARATFAEDAAVLATDSDPDIASKKLQTKLDAIKNWLNRWKIKANESKLAHVTFNTRRETCPQSI
jgi:hypothetical protein